MTSGGVYVGSNYQGGSDLKIAYDTQAITSIFPKTSCTGCPSGWLDVSDSGLIDMNVQGLVDLQNIGTSSPILVMDDIMIG